MTDPSRERPALTPLEWAKESISAMTPFAAAPAPTGPVANELHERGNYKGLKKGLHVEHGPEIIKLDIPRKIDSRYVVRVLGFNIKIK